MKFFLSSFPKVLAYSYSLKTSGGVNFCGFAMSGDCKPSVFFVLGAPGSGKGTLCFNVVKKYNFEHLSAGELLRQEKNTSGSPFGSLIEESIKNGRIVPAHITCSLLEREMNSSRMNYFLIDGFPRNKENIEAWEKGMADKVNFLGVLFLECDEDICIRRCLGRGAAGSGRSDDNEEVLKKRFVTYKQDTMPTVNYFKNQNLVYVLNGSKLREDVFKDVEEILHKVAPLSIRK